MNSKTICFLSTNSIWGGSEILWSYAAGLFLKEGYKVIAGVYYDFSFLKPQIGHQAVLFDLNKRYHFSLAGKVFKRIDLIDYQPKDKLGELLIKEKVDLIVISQGNNYIGSKLMRFCKENDIPFVTLTHLVTEIYWPSFDDKMIEELYELYQNARWNFFVSKHTLSLNAKMLGYKIENAGLTYNPFTKHHNYDLEYPALIDGVYRVVMFGRLECFHKGYDLLIEVLKEDKWKQRSIIFSLYGSGPHFQLIKRMVKAADIKGLEIHEHNDDVAEIWSRHHLLIMPSRMEGQSLTLIESMWMKRAAVVTDVGGVEELVSDGESGFVAPFASAMHIDEALERAWLQRENWKEMGEVAYRRIKECHPENAVEYFSNQIKAVLNGELPLA